MTTITTLPLNQLVPSKANVRKTARAEGLEELAASIAAHGLLQNLQVRAAGDKFEVVAGGRRLAALIQLAKDKTIAADHPVPCHVREGDDATEISLAENIVRAAMHPADQFDAFKKLADEGKSDEEIAARFGIAAKAVKQRLKLAVVSPKLLALYREGKMDLEQLMAFTVSDDHKAQEDAWLKRPAYQRNPSGIKDALTQQHIAADDKRVKFIGLAAYAKAGGQIIRDLFDDKNKGWLTDPALLDRLVAEKLEKQVEALRAEGWKWVEIVPDLDYQAKRGMQQLNPTISAADQKKIDKLEAQIDELQTTEPDGAAEKIDKLTDQIDAILDKTDFDAKDKTIAGAMIGIGYDGKIAIERGLVKPEDKKEQAKEAQAAKGAKPAEGEPQPTGLSAKLVEDLTAHLTAGLQVELAAKPSIALAAVVFGLALDTFYDPTQKSFNIHARQTMLQRHAEGIEATKAIKELETQRKAWIKQLPKDEFKLWSWLLEQSQKTQLELLAFCAATTIDAVNVQNRHAAAAHVSQLAKALKLDMTDYWQADEASYFGRVSKSLILETVSEACTKEKAVNIANLKKDALAKEAAKLLKGKGWLPAILRRHETAK